MLLIFIACVIAIIAAVVISTFYIQRDFFNWYQAEMQAEDVVTEADLDIYLIE